MTLAATGDLSIGGATATRSINLELGRAATATSTLDESALRTLSGVTTAGATISIADFYAKSNRIAYSVTYSGNTLSSTVNIPGFSGYVTGKADVTITINSGVYLWSNSVSNAALSITGNTGDTVTIINNGYIIGQGGDGAGWIGTAGSSTYVNGTAGGPALSLGCTTSITNNGYIAGGGGGGGAAISAAISGGFGGGGGGAGGGAGGSASNNNGSGTNYSGVGGTGGTLGSAGGNGSIINPGAIYTAAGGGGGGRVISASPTAGTGVASSTSVSTTAGGQCGGAGASVGGTKQKLISAAGGGAGWGQVGGTGVWHSTAIGGAYTVTSTGGSGGTFGNGNIGVMTTTDPAGFLGIGNYAGYAGGNSITKNGNTVTITSGGANIYGAQV